MGGGKFMFQEEEVATSELGRTHSNDNVVDEYEEKLAALQTLRENDMEKISSLGEIIDQVCRVFTRVQTLTNIQTLTCICKL